MERAELVGEGLCQSKIDDSIFYGLFLALKIKSCLTIDEIGVIQEHRMFKRFNDTKRFLYSSQVFKMIQGKKYLLCCQRIGKKCLIEEFFYIIPTKMRICNECNDKIMCSKCKIQVNENKEFEVYLNLIKRQAPNQFGHMFPYFKE